MRDHFFYIAECADGSLYSGTCLDLKEREAMHNSGKGAKYTRSRRPVAIVYHEKYETLSDARSREMKVKRMTREQKLQLIESGEHD